MKSHIHTLTRIKFDGPHHNDTCQHVEVFGLEAWESNAGRIRSTCQSVKMLNLEQFKQSLIKGVEEVKQLTLHDIFFQFAIGNGVSALSL